MARTIPTVAAGSTVTWTYDVTNTRQRGPERRYGHRRPGRGARLPVSGDTNSNGQLDLGETWVYTATGTAIAGQYTNTATATATDATGTVAAGQRQRQRRLLRRAAGHQTCEADQRHDTQSERGGRQHGHLDLRRDQHGQRGPERRDGHATTRA